MNYLYPCECVGGDCDCYGPYSVPYTRSTGLAGMGSVAPGGVPAQGGSGVVTSIESAVTKGIQDVLTGSILGFGKGRAEADLIVPVQNAMVARLSQIIAAYPTASLSSCQALYNELKSMKSTFINFCNDPRFTDGRASHQALYGTGTPSDPGMLFYFDDNLNKIAARIQSLGGGQPDPTLPLPYTPPPHTTTAGFGNLDTTTLIALGVGALILFKGKIL